MTDIRGNLTHGSAVALKAGSYYDKSFDYYMGSAIAMAEGTINATTRQDWSSIGGSDLIGSAYKGIFSDIASSLAAIHAISWNINSYPTRITAEDAINVQRDNALRGLAIIKDFKVVDFLKGQ